MARGEHAVHLRADFLRRDAGAADTVDARHDHPSRHLVAEIDHRLDHAVLLGKGETVARRHVEP